MKIEKIAARHGWYWLCKQKVYKHASKGKRTETQLMVLYLANPLDHV